jgi:hypothetical protein
MHGIGHAQEPSMQLGLDFITLQRMQATSILSWAIVIGLATMQLGPGFTPSKLIASFKRKKHSLFFSS